MDWRRGRALLSELADASDNDCVFWGRASRVHRVVLARAEYSSGAPGTLVGAGVCGVVGRRARYRGSSFG